MLAYSAAMRLMSRKMLQFTTLLCDCYQRAVRRPSPLAFPLAFLTMGPSTVHQGIGTPHHRT